MKRTILTIATEPNIKIRRKLMRGEGVEEAERKHTVAGIARSLDTWKQIAAPRNRMRRPRGKCNPLRLEEASLRTSWLSLNEPFVKS